VEQSFNDLILQCVEDGLLVLGESGRHVVFWRWQSEAKRKKEDIPASIQEFAEFLESMFGTGAKILEQSMIREIEVKFSISNKGATDLAHAVQYAKERFNG
jgi:hypothetical protein